MFLVGVRRHVLALSIASAVCFFGHSYLLGQDSKATKSDDQETADSAKETAKPSKDQVDPLKRPLGDKERKANEKRFKQEVSGSYKKWLDEDVRWIITDEERSAFKQLSNDEERDQFIEAFWQRRDPTPDTVENEFKEEHYRRIAYANERFASGIHGWGTDRGRIYIMWGPPDEIESHPTCGNYNRLAEEGGGQTETYAFEQWRYRYMEGIGNNIIIEFVDPSGTGEYHMTMDPGEKDALAKIPGAGLSMMEQ